jgi:hypothetical protein
MTEGLKKTNIMRHRNMGHPDLRWRDQRSLQVTGIGKARPNTCR